MTSLHVTDLKPTRTNKLERRLNSRIRTYAQVWQTNDSHSQNTQARFSHKANQTENWAYLST